MSGEGKAPVKRSQNPLVKDFADKQGSDTVLSKRLRAPKPFEPFIHDGPFRLFDLPTELWDIILKFDLDDGVETRIRLKTHEAIPPMLTDAGVLSHHENCTPGAWVLRAPRTNTLLANKRLNVEYARAAAGAQVLILRDTPSYSFSDFDLPTPSLYLVKELEIHLFLFCVCWNSWNMHHRDPTGCRATIEVFKHSRWIKALVPRLPRLKSMTINYNIAYCHSEQLNKANLLPCIPFVKKSMPINHDIAPFKSYSLAYVNRYMHASHSGPRNMLLTAWKDEDGCWKTETPPPPPTPPVKVAADATEEDATEDDESTAAEEDGSSEEGGVSTVDSTDAQASTDDAWVDA